MRDRMFARIERQSAESAQNLAANGAVVSCGRLPFYRSHRLVRVRTLYADRPVVLHYADDGSELLPMGSPDHFQRVNAREHVTLEEDGVLDYLRVYAEVTTGLRIVESDADLPWLAASRSSPAEIERRLQAAMRIGPAEIRTRADDGWAVVAPGVIRRELAAWLFAVRADGLVVLLDQRLLGTDLQVPDPLPLPDLEELLD
jgi:hypothetical protein